MAPNRLTISFVSGKGGVGKTSLASNFAWICSRFAKTVLVDLDFQNQGCTGLFLSSVSQTTCGAFEVLSQSAKLQACQPTQVEDNLHFIPAVSILSPPEYALMPTLLASPRLGAGLGEYVRALHDEFAFEVVILDCHGGLDYASVAAFQVSSHTIMVTEADAVTFNGTLELLSFYDSQQQRDHITLSDPRTPAIASSPSLVEQANQDVNGRTNIQFIVNRLPSKYKFQDIRATYHRLLQNYKGRLNLTRNVLSFIPEENFIAETFGEYPFVVKLAPTAIVARKLQLMAFQLLRPGDAAVQKYRPFRRLRSPRFRKKIERSVISAEGKNTKRIIQAFGLSVSVVSLFMIAYLLFLSLNFAFQSAERAYDAIYDNKTFITIAIVSAVSFFFYVVKAQFGLMFYYRDQYRFRRALLRATGARPNVWQRLMLLRLWILRAGNSILPIFIMALLAFYTVIIVGLLIEGLLKR